MAYRPMAYRHIGYNVLAFGTALVSAIALNVATTSAPAIAQARCPLSEYMPSTTTRIVQLPQFGAQITIPAHFRAMALQDGGVSILAPYEFEVIQCMNQGRPGPGIEILPTDFHRIENPQGLSAMEYAQIVADQYNNASGGTAFGPKISSQTIDGVEVAILEIASAYDSFHAWYRLDGTDSLVEISSFNDSQLHPLELLSQTQFMRTTPH